MIQAMNISKTIEGNRLLDCVSLEIGRGEFAAVMGPSGSGKSTLLYSVSGMDSITEGNVLFEGVRISGLRPEALARLRLTRMGFVFQTAQLLKNLSILDNIILPGLAAKREPAGAIRQRAAMLMQQMGIEGIGNRDVGAVSGGQLQRAAICRALINKPGILFLDEPTGALNSAAATQVLAILEYLNHQGMTILMVTHDPGVAARAGKVYYIRDGAIADCKHFRQQAGRAAELDTWLGTLAGPAVPAARLMPAASASPLRVDG